MINAPTAAQAAGSNINACQNRAPAAINIAIATTSINTAVPKSCSATNPAKKLTNSNGGIKPFQNIPRSPARRQQCHAITTGMPHFTSSLGCNPIGPIVIHLRAPFTSRPMPGTCTNTNPRNITTTIHGIGLDKPRNENTRSTETCVPIHNAAMAANANHVFRPSNKSNRLTPSPLVDVNEAEFTMTVPMTNKATTKNRSPCPARMFLHRQTVAPH